MRIDIKEIDREEKDEPSIAIPPLGQLLNILTQGLPLPVQDGSQHERVAARKPELIRPARARRSPRIFRTPSP